ncbi:MAG: SUMF1/EgtB/PvdO family nonheme iron enzyme [Lentisphaeria bacterium]|nr:SUMF1/EgtB/PvdO family nonheme iron enzyme [Lentisphaeria bacterium]
MDTPVPPEEKKPLDVDTDAMSTLPGRSSDDEEVMSTEEIRKLLNLSEKNSISGAYDDLHAIGLGGFGAVYGAWEPGLERQLALKILRPNYRQLPERIKAFIREARITARIAHPNIVPVHRIGVFEDAGVYFSMKRIQGETLQSILRHMTEDREGYRKKYNLPRLIDIFMGVCQGVSYAHRSGFLHCDLKPGNVMVGNFGEVLVMDWGLARPLPPEDGEAETPPKEVECEGAPALPLGGTPVFMAPEHLSLNSSQPTIRSDIYALGCVLYSILTWHTAPFDGNGSLEEIQRRVVQGKLVPPRSCAPPGRVVPLELEAICLKAMARHPEDRYARVEELIEDLQRYRDGLPVNAYSPSRIYRAGKFIFRRPLVPAALLLALLVWFVFFLYNSFNELIFVESLRTNAWNYARSGDNSLMQARRRFSRLRTGVGSAADLRNQEQAIRIGAMEAEADFRAAMDSLARIPEKYRNSRLVLLTAGSMFRGLYSFFNLIGDNEKLHQVAKTYSGRWPDIFVPARAMDPDLDKMFRQALSGNGWLEIFVAERVKTRTENGNVIRIVGNGPVTWYVEDGSKQRLRLPGPVDGSFRSGGVLLRFRLPVGLYTVVGSLGGVEKRVPVRVSLSRKSRVDLSRFYRVPEGMVLVPGGEFRHEPELSNSISRFSFEEDFFIKRTEVTVGEYLEFWKSISDPALKERCASYYFSGPDSLHCVRSWDDGGKLLRPGLTAGHPVTGISSSAAEAYCRFLSEKLKRRVALPTSSQWSKAAGGIDGLEYAWGNTYRKGMAVLGTGSARAAASAPGDVSVYGVLDMTGNVREFVKAPSPQGGRGKVCATMGGSYDSAPGEARLSEIVYSVRGGDDTGFRYVMFPVEKERVPVPEK